MRRLLGIVACAAVLAAPVAHAAPPKARALVVTGQGGQTVDLVVPKGGMTVEYPWLVMSGQRLPGDDTAIGGVALQRASDGELAGGVLLHNAPGFDYPLSMGLVEHDRTKLPAGRFRLTLLGTGPQTVRLDLPGSRRDLRLVTRGPARPVTRTVGGTAVAVDQWTATLGRIGPDDQLVVGGGAGGELQQAVDVDLCVQPGAGGVCVAGDGGSFFSPGAGGASGWYTGLYGQGSLVPGDYAFSGRVMGAGASTAGHLAVVISLPR